MINIYKHGNWIPRMSHYNHRSYNPVIPQMYKNILDMFEVWRNQVLKVGSFIKIEILFQPLHFLGKFLLFFIKKKFVSSVLLPSRSPTVQNDLKVLQLKHFLWSSMISSISPAPAGISTKNIRHIICIIRKTMYKKGNIPSVKKPNKYFVRIVRIVQASRPCLTCSKRPE